MKVFGIGLQRTGLTSLSGALQLLGLRTRQFPWQIYDGVDHPLLADFDAFTDFPIPLMFAKLDAAFPGSKFIHTVRDETAWLESVAWLFSTGARKFAKAWPIATRFHQDFYGTAEFEQRLFLARYHEYNQATAAYFADRPADYLRFDLVAKPGFEPLCHLLGRALPAAPFPHRNKQEGMLTVLVRRWRRQLSRRQGLE